MCKITYLFLFLFFSSNLFAAQDATVVTEGAIVYKSNSFDAPILGYFSEGKKVRVSDKVYGAFYRAVFKKGVIGYISDIDVKVKGQQSFGNAFKNKETKSLNQNRPYLGRTYWGLQFAMVSLSDTVANVSASSNEMMIGASFSSPMAFFNGAFTLSVNALYSPSTPSLYKEMSLQSPEGFVLLSDVQLLYGLTSMLDRKLSMYLGAGAAVNYTDVTIVQDIDGLKSIPVASASFGGAFSIGMAYQLKSLVLKVEPKYFLEEDSYFAVTSSLMMEF